MGRHIPRQEEGGCFAVMKRLPRGDGCRNSAGLLHDSRRTSAGRSGAGRRAPSVEVAGWPAFQRSMTTSLSIAIISGIVTTALALVLAISRTRRVAAGMPVASGTVSVAVPCGISNCSWNGAVHHAAAVCGCVPAGALSCIAWQYSRLASLCLPGARGTRCRTGVGA